MGIENKRTEVGSPINFRGFIYSPINEQGVVYLFGLIAEDLNMRVESIQQGYPDCTAIRYLGKGRWERVSIEFEYVASNFSVHGHSPEECDIIVCWINDLAETEIKKFKEQNLEIIELRSEIGGLDNPPLEEPDKVDTKEEVYGLTHHIHKDWYKTKELFEELDKRIKEISPEIWRKIAKHSITYYSPEKVFIYMHPQKQGIKLHLFLNGEKTDGIDFPYTDALKWGRTYLKDKSQLDVVLNGIKKAYNLINYAIKEGLNTGWFSVPEDGEEMEDHQK